MTMPKNARVSAQYRQGDRQFHRSLSLDDVKFYTVHIWKPCKRAVVPGKHYLQQCPCCHEALRVGPDPRSRQGDDQVREYVCSVDETMTADYVYEV